MTHFLDARAGKPLVIAARSQQRLVCTLQHLGIGSGGETADMDPLGQLMVKIGPLNAQKADPPLRDVGSGRCAGPLFRCHRQQAPYRGHGRMLSGSNSLWEFKCSSTHSAEGTPGKASTGLVAEFTRAGAVGDHYRCDLPDAPRMGPIQAQIAVSVPKVLTGPCCLVKDSTQTVLDHLDEVAAADSRPTRVHFVLHTRRRLHSDTCLALYARDDDQAHPT